MTTPLPDPDTDRIVPRSQQPCGCYIRLPDYQTVMCREHGARRDARRADERARRQAQAAARAARLPWNGPGGGAFKAALVFALMTVIACAFWTTDAAHQDKFDAGYGTTTADVLAYEPGARGVPSYFEVAFTTADGEPVTADLEDYDAGGPDVGGRVGIDYALSDPMVVREAGYDSAGATATDAAMAGTFGATTLALAGWWAHARVTARRGATT